MCLDNQFKYEQAKFEDAMMWASTKSSKVAIVWPTIENSLLYLSRPWCIAEFLKATEGGIHCVYSKEDMLLSEPCGREADIPFLLQFGMVCMVIACFCLSIQIPLLAHREAHPDYYEEDIIFKNESGLLVAEYYECTGADCRNIANALCWFPFCYQSLMLMHWLLLRYLKFSKYLNQTLDTPRVHEYFTPEGVAKLCISTHANGVMH